jgi:hypothetical protein
VSVGESKLCQRLAAKFGAESNEYKLACIGTVYLKMLFEFLKSHANYSKG